MTSAGAQPQVLDVERGAVRARVVVAVEQLARAVVVAEVREHHGSIAAGGEPGR